MGTGIFRKRTGKKGFVFTLDAFLASAVLIAGLVLLAQYSVNEHPKESMQYSTTDLLTAMSELKMSDLAPSVFSYYNSSSIYTSQNLSILEQVGTYWAANETGLAQNLTLFFIEGLIQNNTGIEFLIANDQLYLKNITSKVDIYASDRMITGVLQGAPLTGSTSSAYLRKITDKRTKSFAYFGGFVGQGNLTVFIEVPSDVYSGDVSQMLLELDAGGNFSLYLNDNHCADFTPIPGNMSPGFWDVTSCNSSIQPGRNNVTLKFQNPNYAYVAGGYFRIDYKTDELKTSLSLSNKTYYFPEIRGVVNLYDSFYVPGNLTSMTLYLHYLANHSVLALNSTFYLTIGNNTIFVDTDSTTEQSITIDDMTLQTLLNYSNLNLKTVPIRMGFENISYDAQLIGNSEVMMITDVSGSMNWRMDVDNVAGFRRNCDNASFNNSDTQRLSVAKCLDKDFAANVLNISGNTLGIVSYSTTTQGAQTVAPTTNLALIQSTIGTADPETGYTPLASTCICCGINSARDQLVSGVSKTTLITSGASWKYNTNDFQGMPANDSQGDAWYEFDYDDSAWSSGNAVLGHYIGGTVLVTTDLNTSNLSSSLEYVNFWELSNDTAGPPADFSSGLINSTGNTFGVAGADDGWDWAGGASAYGYSSNADFNNATGYYLNMDFRTGSPAQNRCTNNDCSGAYGIKLNITSTMLDYLSNNGTATLSFYYEWLSNNNVFENSDEAWIKAKWILPNGTEYWLGTNKDSLHSGSDSDPEIDAAEDPDQRITGNAQIDLTSTINSAGMYYLHFGGKLRANAIDEWGNVYIDDVQIRITNKTDKYYFRKHFNIANLNSARRGFINLLSDDYSKVYVNGNVVFDGQAALNGTYWDRRGLLVEGKYFKTGDNVVAVELVNNGGSAKFDMELIGVNKSNQGAMLLMTDGQANVGCAEQGVTGDLDNDGSADTDRDDAIQAACDARQDWGLQVFAVGFSAAADESTLQGIATCADGLYAKSDNVSALSDFYNQVVLNIISATVKSQTIILSGGSSSASNLYGDSYMRYTFDPFIEEPEPNEIGVEMQTVQFGTCSPTVTIPLGIRVIDAKVTSYSGEHWTKLLSVNSNVVFNLSEYDSNFIYLGDPFVLQAPANLITTGPNTFSIDTGDEPLNSTGCSPNNTLIYTALVPSTTTRSGVVEKTEGCNWTIQFEDDTLSNKIIPSGYAGTKKCSFTETNFTLGQGAYNPNDAYDIAVFSILKALDFDGNGKVFVNLDAEDIEIVITTISAVPYMWGPSIVSARVWQ